MFAERNGQEIEIGLTLAEWNEVLGALNHTTAFPGTPGDKFLPLNKFKAVVQKACWNEGQQVHQVDPESGEWLCPACGKGREGQHSRGECKCEWLGAV